MRTFRLQVFNSHPHKEDDVFIKFIPIPINFSTHILTRRMTLLLVQMQLFMMFSTHILTRRMTRSELWIDARDLLFNSHPHKEDDAASRLLKNVKVFSTHILTRRMT